MGWHCQWQVTCDRCGAAGPLADRSLDAQDLALAAGWLRGQHFSLGIHLCPACVSLGLPPWWPDAPDLHHQWETPPC